MNENLISFTLDAKNFDLTCERTLQKNKNLSIWGIKIVKLSPASMTKLVKKNSHSARKLP